MTERNPLEGDFARARAGAPVPSDDLMARVLADAEMEATRRRAVPKPQVKLAGIFGGWRGAAAMGSAALAGLVLGFFQPALLPEADLWTGEAGYDLLDLAPGYGEDLFAEG